MLLIVCTVYPLFSCLLPLIFWNIDTIIINDRTEFEILLHSLSLYYSFNSWNHLTNNICLVVKIILSRVVMQMCNIKLYDLLCFIQASSMGSTVKARTAHSFCSLSHVKNYATLHRSLPEIHGLQGLATRGVIHAILRLCTSN